ncbi:quinone oxidoreductase family protein [Streptomyces albipurpureus]|uniref:Zinc-binding alcohol dehydrogenase family protein n=1 Tax=Streptomyces albipurpureus TaxID=2897419 RepID=A0ABT0UJU3_9ACTN|nr:zinc-binding alcohol dehydrogenase family protein [Streptomyces sp. CWNU-1]MCM2388621.1 zinc-binding alcohol dehydrogenase family protein [Streptomyces sp. CWNU-1]
MKAAVITELGKAPHYGDFDDPQPAEDEAVVTITAAGVNHFTVLMSSGKFYATPPKVPFVPGSDGIGLLENGSRVFFDVTVPPFGAWGERALVPRDALLAVDPAADDISAAAVGNSGLAAWTALSWRAKLVPGETVLVLGAAGALGRIAVQAARAQGAGRVVAADLGGERLTALTGIGADAVVAIDGDDGDPAQRLREATDGGADVIIDPLWGAPALAALQAAAQGCRHIQLGHMADPEMTLPAAVLRSRGVDLRGYALFQCPLPVRQDAYLTLTRLIGEQTIAVDAEAVPLRDVGAAWERQVHGAGRKLVLVP